MLILKAPAKINWFLNILGMRDDGFHEIQSLIQKITLFDELSFSPSNSLRLTTDVPVALEQNLVYRAAMLLKETYGVTEGATIHLDKKIPMGAGLGGGSSDAASALAGLNELWSLDLSLNELSEIAGSIGSDIPFFLYNSMSYVDGRGERISPRSVREKLHLLLVKPYFNISTEWSYKTFALENHARTKHDAYTSDMEHNAELTKKEEKDNNIEHFIRKIERAEIRELAGVVSNDLELIAIKNFPVIAEIKNSLLDRGALFSLMSGSGSTVFGVFDTKENAEKASQEFDGFWTAVVETIVD
ncbi:MAG: 4-(cytidine 5'-diphospho)-2-C-methyl-D-erythritol kinase [Nitrospirota bacterium]